MGNRRWICPLLIGGLAYRAWSGQALPPAEEALLEVWVNGEKQPAWTMVEVTADGSPWVSRRELQGWGILAAQADPLDRSAPDALVALNALPGIQSSVNRSASQLTVEVQPALLQTHEYSTEVAARAPTPSPFGVFVNYDIGVQQASNDRELRAATEEGIVFGDWIARTSWFSSVGSGSNTNVRLDSNFTADFPATRSSLQWGDTFARLGVNAEAVRIGGFSWGTDFSVTPTFITVPLPTINNVAASPGSVDVYVNGAKTQQLSIPGGPFSITNVPVTTGPGELTVVTRDLSGRTQAFTQSYYVAPQMLQQGLNAWDFEFGSKRLQYGAASNDYTGWIAAGGDRYGVSERATAQWRVEADETGAAVSALWLGLAPGNRVLTLSSSCSAVSGHTGCLLDAAYERDLSSIGYGSDLQLAESNYIPVAAAERSPSIRWQLFSHIQASGAFGTSLMFAGIWRQQADGPHSLNLNFTLGKSWFHNGHLDFVVGRTYGASASSYVTLIYTHSIDAARTLSTSAYSTDGLAGGQATLQQNLPAGDGLGYLVRASQDSSASLQANAQWNGDAVALAGSVQRQGDRSAASGEVSGAALWFGNSLFASRHIDRSFAVVHADDLPDVPVYLNDQQAARTDARGVAVLPDLRAFEVNKIDLDITSVPLSLEIPQAHFEVTPYRRGGAYVDIRVRLGADVRLHVESGEPVPAGARVHEPGGQAPVGSDGRAYVEAVAGDNSLRVTWEGGECRIHLKLPAVDEEASLLCEKPR